MSKISFRLTALFVGVTVLLPLLSPGLSSAEVELDKIVITANQFPQNESDAPQSVDVITREDIAREKATNVADALRNVSGVDVVSLGAPGEDLDIRIRGSDRDEVLVLLDGIPINNIIESRALILQSIPAAHIERIEVVRGAQSVLYGGSANGGVINVITRKKSKEPLRSLAFDAGNLGRFQETATFIQSFGKHHFGATYSRLDQYGRFANDRFGGNSAFLNYGFAPSDLFRLQLNVTYLNQDQDLAFSNPISFASFPTVNYYIARDFDRHLARDFFVPQITLQSAPADWYTLKFSYGLYYETQSLLNSNQGETPPEPAATLDTQDFDSSGHRHRFDLQNRLELLNHDGIQSHLIVGGTADWESLSYTDGPFPGDVTAETTVTFPDETLGQKGSRYNLAGYILSSSSFQERFWLSAGLRYDNNSTYSSAFSPRFSLAYLIKPTRTKISAGFSQGFYAPTINQYYLAVIGGTLTQRLDKEISSTYEIGVRQELLKDKISAEATYFYTDYDTFINETQLIADAHVNGVETELNLKPLSWLQVDSSYTFMDSENDATGATLANRPSHRFSGDVILRPVSNWDILLNAEYVSSRVIPNIISTQAFGDLTVAFFDQFGNPAGSELPSYAVFNLASRYKHHIGSRYLKELIYSFRINNLFNKAYQEKFGYPMPRFNFIAGVEGRF